MVEIKLWTINRILMIFGLVLTIITSDDPDFYIRLRLEKRSTFLKRVNKNV